MSPEVSRRQFLAAAAVTAAVGATTEAHAADKAGPPLCIFSKHLQFIRDFKELARTYKDLGLDGCDLTVRKGGHIDPADVADKLPACLDAFRNEGLDVYMVTTYLRDGHDPDAEPILKAASKAGIRYFRCGTHEYSSNGAILNDLDRYTEEVRALARLAERYNMVGGYHNHSGPNKVGAALWDLHRMYTAIGSDHLGSNFDIGHATIEGSYGAWRINARLLAPYVKMMAAKDFVWTDAEAPKWVPLGTGRIQTVEFLKIFREAHFVGPISIHFEYPLKRDEALDHMRKAVQTMRSALKKAGYA